jgi:hypothetical protein
VLTRPHSAGRSIGDTAFFDVERGSVLRVMTVAHAFKSEII